MTETSAVIAPDAFEIRGVIEGFYGHPWTQHQRLGMMSFVAQCGMNLFVYSPKDDVLLRDQWAEPFDSESLKDLSTLLAHANSCGLVLSVAISPGLTMRYSSDADRSALVKKFEMLANLGITSYGLFFDDIPGTLQWPEDQATFPSLAHAHRAVSAHIWNALQGFGATQLMVCPTTYWGDGSENYLEQFCEGLDPRIDVLWTGRSICSATLEASDALIFTQTTGRKPLYWDNFPVNDVAMKHELHIGPYERREPALWNTSRGIIANAMEFAEASKIPLYTIGEFLRDPHNYDSESSWNRAIEVVAGDPDDAIAVRAFAENSRSSCLSLSDAEPLNEALGALEFSFLSQDYESGSSAVAELATRYEHAAERLFSQHMMNKQLVADLHGWLGTFELGAQFLRHLATLAAERQWEMSRVMELETYITHMQKLGKRVFGDSLEMLVEHLRRSREPVIKSKRKG
jgi:hyaluronoglucosaminidase|tara:strand:- start:3114 stop:4490 length:1377 start_codon:yes stop_codon:yes gene_type:complete